MTRRTAGLPIARRIQTHIADIQGERNTAVLHHRRKVLLP